MVARVADGPDEVTTALMRRHGRLRAAVHVVMAVAVPWVVAGLVMERSLAVDWGARAANVALFLWVMVVMVLFTVLIGLDGYVAARLHERGVEADL